MAGCGTDDRGSRGEALGGPRDNRPGLNQIGYRLGLHGDFKAALLSRLSSTDFPALTGLTTRGDDDWTIALCDAFAAFCDVFTFYQERIAQESYLRTAVERRSVLELAQLVGYRLSPGSAATTRLAFTLDTPLAPSAPAAPPVAIPIGTRVQSVPSPGDPADALPQVFETTEAIVARAEWNTLRVQKSERRPLHAGQTSIALASIATSLQPGDALLFVGTQPNERGETPFDLRIASAVEIDPPHGVTLVRWTRGLEAFPERSRASEHGGRIYAMRQRGSLFGHNAPDPNLVVPPTLAAAQRAALVDVASDGSFSWKGYPEVASGTLELDAVYPKIVPSSWIVLATDGKAELRRVRATAQISRVGFGASAKVTTLALEKEVRADRRRSVVFAQSEELTQAEQVLRAPVFGDQIRLQTVEPALARAQWLAVDGKRARVTTSASAARDVQFPQMKSRKGMPHETFIVLAAPVLVSGLHSPLVPEQLEPDAGLRERLRWRLLDHDGQPVVVEAQAGALSFVPPHEQDPVVRELVMIGAEPRALQHGRERTTLLLHAPLKEVYDRDSTFINANVAAASHGERVAEVSGANEAAATGGGLMLRQGPLTYVPAVNEQGRSAALEVRVDEVTWYEVSSLYGQSGTAPVYALQQDDVGRTTVLFGDGREGAPLPRGNDNLRFAYRKGIGSAGNVGSSALTTLISRPLGVRSATNPEPASGGEDPERIDDARRNAPSTVLTFGRIVSLLDYADFARAFTGISKAVSSWLGGDKRRGVHLTIAGVDGAPVLQHGVLFRTLLAALRSHGDALLPLHVQSFDPVYFHLKLRVAVHAEYEVARVLADVEARLREALAFEARDFAQPVTLDEVVAVAHEHPGVQAVDVEELHAKGAPIPKLKSRLHGHPARVTASGQVLPAEILVLDPHGLVLEPMR